MSALTDLFSNIADALRTKGVSGQIKASDFPTKIAGISAAPKSQTITTSGTAPSRLTFSGLKGCNNVIITALGSTSGSSIPGSDDGYGCVSFYTPNNAGYFVSRDLTKSTPSVNFKWLADSGVCVAGTGCCFFANCEYHAVGW